MSAKDRFYVEPEKPQARFSQIVRLDKDGASVLFEVQKECVRRGINITTSKLVSDMIRFCAERAYYGEGEKCPE